MEGITIPIPSAGWIDAVIATVAVFVASKWPPAGEFLRKILTQRKWFWSIMSAAIPLLNAKFGWGISEGQVYASMGALAAAVGAEWSIDKTRMGNGHAAPPAAK